LLRRSPPTGYADLKSACYNVRYYAIQITASQFLDKPCNASASDARGYKCKICWL